MIKSTKLKEEIMFAQKAFSEGEVFLAVVEDQPSFFARIENIEADVKKGWWRVTFVILNIPLVTSTWIVDDDQIRGADFTMGGIPIRLEQVVAPKPQESDHATHEHELMSEDQLESSGANILSFSDGRQAPNP